VVTSKFGKIQELPQRKVFTGKSDLNCQKEWNNFKLAKIFQLGAVASFYDLP